MYLDDLSEVSLGMCLFLKEDLDVWDSHALHDFDSVSLRQQNGVPPLVLTDKLGLPIAFN